MAGASTDVETAHGFITIRALPSLKVGISAAHRHILFAALHAEDPDLPSEAVASYLASTAGVYTSYTWAAFHGEWNAYRQTPPPYLCIPEPEASPHLIAGILVSEGSLLANICKANKNQLAKLFVAKYELLPENLWLHILRDLSNRAMAAAADKRPERNRQRPELYFREIAPEDFVPLALRTHRATPVKASPLKSKRSTPSTLKYTPLWSKPSPRSAKSTPLKSKSHKHKPVTPSAKKACIPHTPRSRSSLIISASPSQSSKRQRLIPVVDLTDLGSLKRRSARTAASILPPSSTPKRRASILREAHWVHIRSGCSTESRLARTLSREHGESEAFWSSEYDMWMSRKGPYSAIPAHLRPVRKNEVYEGTGRSKEEAVDLSILDDEGACLA